MVPIEEDQHDDDGRLPQSSLPADNQQQMQHQQHLHVTKRIKKNNNRFMVMNTKLYIILITCICVVMTYDMKIHIPTTTSATFLITQNDLTAPILGNNNDNSTMDRVGNQDDDYQSEKDEEEDEDDNDSERKDNAGHQTTRTRNHHSEISSSSSPSSSSSNLKHFYHGLWNFTSHTITIPDKQPNDPITSLEILQNILQQDNYEENIKRIMTEMKKNTSLSSLSKLTTTLSSPSCITPNIPETKQLVELVENGTIQLGLPILNVGMPKTGSSTFHNFFTCAGYRSNHDMDGYCMYKAITKMNKKGRGLPNPISGCQTSNGMEALMQLDIQKPPLGQCWYPQISFLDEFHAEVPNATLIIAFRPIKDWIASAIRWTNMNHRWNACRHNIPGLIRHENINFDEGTIWTEEDVSSNATNTTNTTKKKTKHHLDFYDIEHYFCNHVKHIREFVKQYPSHNLIELDLYNSEETSDILTKLFITNDNISTKKNRTTNSNNNETNETMTNATALPDSLPSCWGHHNVKGNAIEKLQVRKRQEKKKQKQKLQELEKLHGKTMI